MHGAAISPGETPVFLQQWHIFKILDPGTPNFYSFAVFIDDRYSAIADAMIFLEIINSPVQDAIILAVFQSHHGLSADPLMGWVAFPLPDEPVQGLAGIIAPAQHGIDAH